MQNCMAKYRNDFAVCFARLMQDNLREWKELQRQERKRLYSIDAICEYFIAALIGFLPGKREHQYDLKLHCIFAVLVFVASIIINIGLKNMFYQRAIKRTLFPKLLQVFDKDIIYGIHTLDKSLFNSSELFKKEVNRQSLDDCFGGRYNNVDFSVAEVELKNVISQKNKSELFKGVAMNFKMNKQINSRIIIHSKGLFSAAPKGYEKVNLEYEKFNKKFDVWVKKSERDCDGQIEARYLLNVSFLERFMQLKTSFRVRKMSCSVYGDTILVLLKTGKDVFEMNHLLRPIDDVSQYSRLFDEFASVLSFIDVLNLASKTKL